MAQPLWKTGMEVSQTMRRTMRSISATPGYTLEGKEITSWVDICTLMSTATLFTIVKIRLVCLDAGPIFDRVTT